MHEPPSRYNVTVTVTLQASELPEPVLFAVVADRAAWCRSASIVSAHMTDRIISIVTVYAPDRHAAAAVARAVVSDALRQLDPAAGAAAPGAEETRVIRLSRARARRPGSRRAGDGRGQLA